MKTRPLRVQHGTKWKSMVRWSGVFVSVLSISFAFLIYIGFWNDVRGDNLLAAVAARFDRSYSPDAGLPVRRGDKEWPPLIRVITKYSHAQLPKNRTPVV